MRDVGPAFVIYDRGTINGTDLYFYTRGGLAGGL